MGAVLAIPTFDLVVRKDDDGGRAAAGGQVPLPVKVVRVAIPEGVDVSLETIRAPHRLLRGLRLGPGKTSGLGRPDDGTGPTAAPEAGKAIAVSHAASSGVGGGRVPVRLGRIGYFRFQKFVEVIYTPLLDPRLPGGLVADTSTPGGIDLTFFPDVEANLIVSGLEPERAAEESAGTYPDRSFEEAYRAAFINYEEGRAFRSRRGTASQLPQLAGAPQGASASEGSESLLTGAQTALSPFASAITPVYKIAIKSTGLYRLSHSYLLDPNSGVAPGLAGADPQTFKMLNQGIEVPIRVAGEADHAFGPTDFIEFYGEGLVGEPDVVVNLDLDTIGLPGFPDIFQANDVTDENIYFLFAEPPGPRSRVPDLNGAVNAFPLATTFGDTARREFDPTFAPLGFDDPFFQGPALRPNSGAFTPDPNAPNCGYVNPPAGVNTSPGAKFLAPLSFTSDPNHACLACELSLPGVFSTANPATVRIRWRGASALAASPDHLIVAQVGSSSANYGAHCFDNETMSTQSFTVPQTALQGGAGLFIESPGQAADPTRREGAFLDFVEVDYERSLSLSGNELRARLTNADRTYQIGGFASSSSANMIVYDISRKVGGSNVPSPRRVVGGSILGAVAPFSLKYSLAADATLPPAGSRLFAAAGQGGFRTPVRTTVMTGDDLLDTNTQADYIVIGHPSTLDLAPGSLFTQYLAHRAADSGLTTRVVMIDDIYEQFSNGIESPEALRSFLAYAFDNWRAPGGAGDPPSYVLLVGDISLDYKNNLNKSDWVNQVPTFILYQESSVLAYFASDNNIAAFRGTDQLPDLHLGRIPVRTLAESNAVFAKMLDYDLSPPAGSWKSRALLIADQGKSCGESEDFENIQEGIRTTYFQAPFGSARLHLDDPNYGVTVCGDFPNTTSFRQDITAALDAGYALTSFLGHGAFQVWGNLGYYDPTSVASLFQNDQPSFLVNENCLMGGFHAFGSLSLGPDSLGEAFMKAPRKGAIAVFAPAGLSFAFTGQEINQQLYGDIFGLMKERRFGNLITAIRAAISNTIVDMQSYVLLGDPAQRLILPAPRPPINFSASSGSGQVVLTWSSGPDPGVLTRVYRTSHPALPYALLTPSGVPGTSYADANVINGNVYFYRLTSVDPAGPFEGAPTNLNGDCDTSSIPDSLPASGPDCKWARPLNPNPPGIPSGFNVFNTGAGDRLRVVWDLLPDNDIARYTVRYGTVSGGPYPLQAEFDSASNDIEVGGLTAGTTYFMVLTATNLSGLTGAPTQQRSGKPTVYEGINPPAMITTLNLRRSPGFPDAVELSWIPPAFDIYGGPITIASFKIYRGVTPGFIPSPSNLIATITNPSTTLYNDRNTWTSPQNFYYLITTTDTRGFTSGASHELPLGISDLTVTLTGTNGLRLTWPAVTQDVTGALSLIDHYDLYVDTSPLGRVRIDALAPDVANIRTNSVEIPDPGPGLHFLSVIVVDIRGNKSPF